MDITCQQMWRDSYNTTAFQDVFRDKLIIVNYEPTNPSRFFD
jgi:hypothetical protein